MEIKPVAHIHTDYNEKFGIPRQSGLTSARGVIVFEEKYKDPNYLRGIEEFSHLWIIWGFSENIREEHSPTVRPPKLGGEERRGVFSTRSPFRPNNLGLSSVKLVEVIYKDGPLLVVEGVDMLDGTPVYDIKPYIPYSDIHKDAAEGFTGETRKRRLEVFIPSEIEKKVDPEKLPAIKETLALDPRPAFMEKMDREYGLSFGEYNILFTVNENKIVVTDIN